MTLPTIRVTKVTDGRYFAELLHDGRAYRVPNVELPWPGAEWPTYYDALKAADEYRKTWRAPSKAAVADMDRRANEVSEVEGWH